MFGFVTLWTVALQTSLSMGFSRQKFWSGLLFPTPGDLPDPEIKSMSCPSPKLQADSLPVSHLGSPVNFLILLSMAEPITLYNKYDSFQVRLIVKTIGLHLGHLLCHLGHIYQKR